MSSQLTKFSKIRAYVKKHPVVRGMVSYSIVWPLGSAVQQIMVSDEEVDLARVARYGVYGCFYVAPTLYCWIKIANTIWPLNTLKYAITKGVVEQFTYTPFAMTSFYFGMTLMEGRTIEEAKDEVKAKFLPTYKVGALIWPMLQTFNYTVIREKDRIVFVSLCSFLWTTFLAYMKQLKKSEVPGIVHLQPSLTTAHNEPPKHIHFLDKSTNQHFVIEKKDR